MTTISAVVFLYSPDTKVAAIAILNLDEAGEAGAAAACAVLITAASTVVTLLFMALGAWVDRRTQAWRADRRALRRRHRGHLHGDDPDGTRRDPAHPRPADHDASAPSARCCATGARGTPSFIAVTAELRRQLLAIVHGEGSHVVVPLQGSGTFSVEAAVATLVPKDGHVLVLDNGAYCKRLGRLATLMGRRTTILGHAEDAPVSPSELEAALRARTRASPTSASSTARPAPACSTRCSAVSDVCARHGKGLIVDAMSSFAALPIDAREVRFDALVAASGKCLEGVPGMGFVFVRNESMAGGRGQLAFAGDGPARPARLHGKDRPVALHAADPRGRGARRGDPPVRRGGRPAGAAGALRGQLRGARRRHGRARLRAVPGPADPGADHPHLPCAGRSAATSSRRSTRRSRRAASSSTRASSRSSRPSASAASARSGRARCARRWRRSPGAMKALGHRERRGGPALTCTGPVGQRIAP